MIRIAASQYRFQAIGSFAEFAARVETHVAAASEFGARLLVMPEYLTFELLTVPGAGGIETLPDATQAYEELFAGLSARHAIAVVAGTHLVSDGNGLRNTAHLFLPDGRIERQAKLHLTPCEVAPWRLTQGESLRVFDLGFARVAMPVCYDVEFPELGRQARARGADILLVPSCTDDAHGMARVRICSAARAIENQVYVAVAMTTGSLPNVPLMRANHGQAALLSPCDYPFPPGGVLAEGIVNDDQVVAADFDMGALARARNGGSVRTWQDRRPDLYTLES
ncbi:MAG: carbon-nitrogen hydrolase family protein [Tagaea sp.]|nr:carbon-nitrogen hydrolase family protein [Tagaea sp.]